MEKLMFDLKWFAGKSPCIPKKVTVIKVIIFSRIFGKPSKTDFASCFCCRPPKIKNIISKTTLKGFRTWGL